MNGIEQSVSWHLRVSKYLHSLLDGSLHSKRIESLANATLGIMTGTSLAISLIGQALAQARGLNPKHAIKQVDRLLSNKAIDVWEIFAIWVPEVFGQRREIVVAMDWTDYDSDGHSTLVLSAVTSHGRATPLIWLTVHKDELKDRRNDYEDACLIRLSEVIPVGAKVTILADRGFGDTKLFNFLIKIGFSFVIRFRANVNVTAMDGEMRAASEWVGKGGRARKLRNARVTTEHQVVGAVVCVRAKGMKEVWCLAASDERLSASTLIRYYARRWTIEPSFRDTKDLRFGMGLSSIHISDPMRRDRLLLLNAIAIALLTLLGAAGERLGMDRHLKVNTTKRRTHSLFRQGCMLYDLIPNMPESRLLPLMTMFSEMMAGLRTVTSVFAAI